MCGIIAYISADGRGIECASRALGTLRHRGPDGHGIHTANGVTLGHTRLSIIDIEGGAQPIHDTASGVTVAVNGEFYDYRETMKRCETHGYRRQTHSDSEILIPLYLRHGLDVASHMRGEFAFIIHDERRNLVIAARDRFGIKPLCWYQDSERIIIASEAKAVMACGVQPQLDRYSFMRAATMHYHPTERTLFQDIRQVEPGHMLVISDGKVKDVCYWDLDYPQLGTVAQPAENAVETFREKLIDAIRQRLVADTDVCCHLSGGLDSSCVAGIAAKELGSPLHCFSIVFDYADEEYDEHALARETAAFCGSTLHTVNVTQADILDNLGDAVWFSEGLAVNGHLSCKYLLNKEIRRHGYKVALTGEGADECVVGYSHLRRDAYALLSRQENESLTKRLYAENRGIVGVEIPYGDTLPLDSVLKRLGHVPSFLTAKASIGAKVYDVLSPDIKAECLGRDLFGEMLDHYDTAGQLERRHPIDISLYLWIKLTLANYILGTLGDGCEMSASVEGRLPFLDHSLFEYARSLPMDLKLRGTTEKYILKEAAKPYVTPRIYHRQKHPFQSPPITEYLNSRRRDYLVDTLSASPAVQRGYFDRDALLRLLTSIPSMDVVQQTAYEPVVMLALTTHHLMQRFNL